MTELLDKVETKTENNNSYKKYLLGVIAVAAALFVYHEVSKNKPTTPINPELAPKCASTWEMPGISHNNGEWIAGGVPEIKKTGEKTDARAVITNWFDQIDNDNTTLDYFAESVHYAADKNIVTIDKNQLVNSDGCATEIAVNESDYIKNKLKSADIHYGLAPITGKNSFIDIRGTVETSAVTSDREAIVIDFHNGNVLYVLGICGNVVTVENIQIIKETKKETTKHETHHDKKHKLTEKSNNPSDYKRPGTDSTKDSGDNIKPKATISTPAESTPPKVEVKQPTTPNTNNGTVTD